MTNEEAIKDFQSDIEFCKESAFTEEYAKDIEADLVAIQNIEYRIPKKVCVFYEITIYGEQLDEVACPMCHAFFDNFRSNKPKYCPDCGQALDWTEVTE